MFVHTVTERWKWTSVCSTVATTRKISMTYLNFNTKRKVDKLKEDKLYWRWSAVKHELRLKSNRETLEHILDIAEPIVFKKGKVRDNE